MAGDAEAQAINRTLKEVSASLKQQNRILETLNQNIVELGKRLSSEKPSD